MSRISCTLQLFITSLWLLLGMTIASSQEAQVEPVENRTRVSAPPGNHPATSSDSVSERLDFTAQLKQHVQHLAIKIGERNLRRPVALGQAVDFLEAEFKRYGYQPQRQKFKVHGLDCYNLAAEIKGSKLPEEIVLIGAHYDSVSGSPGANDNGSGTAALLVLAEHFKDFRPERTLRFVAFTNEEPPYFQTRDQMGSWVYAEMCRQADQQIFVVLSLETIGYFTDQADSQHYPPPLDRLYPSTGNFIGFVANVKSAEVQRELVKSFKQHCRVPCEFAALPEVVPGVGWSDHWSFWQEGYRGIMVTDTAPYRYPDYHLRSDTPDKLNYPVFSSVVKGLVEPIKHLTNKSTLPTKK